MTATNVWISEQVTSGEPQSVYSIVSGSHTLSAAWSYFDDEDALYPFPDSVCLSFFDSDPDSDALASMSFVLSLLPSSSDPFSLFLPPFPLNALLDRDADAIDAGSECGNEGWLCTDSPTSMHCASARIPAPQTRDVHPMTFPDGSQEHAVYHGHHRHKYDHLRMS